MGSKATMRTYAIGCIIGFAIGVCLVLCFTGCCNPPKQLPESCCMVYQGGVKISEYNCRTDRNEPYIFWGGITVSAT